MSNSKQFLHEKINLSDQKIHVFLLQLDLFECEEYFSYLTKDECERANKLKIEEKKKQFVITRGALRKVLSTALEIPAQDVSFLYSEQNKPYIKEQYDNQSIEFNISHSGNYALIAINLACKIGVDIEKINKKTDFLSLSKRFFSEAENNELLKLDIDKQLDAFYRIWVMKESFIKANGKGVAFGLNQFSVSLLEAGRSKINIDVSKSCNDNWFCTELMKVDNYKTALTSNDKEKEIIFYQQVR
jgi:4'-phosphopantetheinyl transferase